MLYFSGISSDRTSVCSQHHKNNFYKCEFIHLKVTHSDFKGHNSKFFQSFKITFPHQARSPSKDRQKENLMSSPVSIFPLGRKARRSEVRGQLWVCFLIAYVLTQDFSMNVEISCLD